MAYDISEAWLDDLMIPSGFKHRNTWILTLLMTASYKIQFRIKITRSFIIYFLNRRKLFHCSKITEKEFYWHNCHLLECSLTQNLLLYEGLEPFLCSGLQACIISDMWNVLISKKKKSRVHLLKKKNKINQQLQFPCQKEWCESFGEKCEDQVKPSK